MAGDVVKGRRSIEAEGQIVTAYYDRVISRTLGEYSSGNQLDYTVDTLGSVSGYVNADGAVVNRYWYDPFGAVLSSSGEGAEPDFQYRGTWGYYFLNQPSASHSVGARIYDDSTGRWTSVDPVWPASPAYGYSLENPTTKLDPSGLQANPGGYSDFAIEPTNGSLFGISACIQLPQFCFSACIDDYVNFYMSIHSLNMGVQAGYEAGISFSYQHYGWNGTMKTDGSATPQNLVPASQQAGQVVCMSLIVSQTTGTGTFTLSGASPPSVSKKSAPELANNVGIGKTIFSSQYYALACPTQFSSTFWGASVAHVGSVPVIVGVPNILQSPGGTTAWAPYAGYSTTNQAGAGPVSPDPGYGPLSWNPLAGVLRFSYTTLCSPSQFDDWDFMVCCNDGLIVPGGQYCCCDKHGFYPT